MPMPRSLALIVRPSARFTNAVVSCCLTPCCAQTRATSTVGTYQLASAPGSNRLGRGSDHGAGAGKTMVWPSESRSPHPFTVTGDLPEFLAVTFTCGSPTLGPYAGKVSSRGLGCASLRPNPVALPTPLACNPRLDGHLYAAHS